eukprot:CAMPEP_0198698244 /NCGR_PEP_ID=MMETSP1468-20131203/334462_1 /TAXON_ID=1461545 /ORGANISM="Mantoniella sp, Strain CCMP1436" /LENGTH=52 /DNA_ID=CAMNT_0044455193 /DNA_START=95 /DNA_END=250 /DNA_ORIENTATION=+
MTREVAAEYFRASPSRAPCWGVASPPAVRLLFAPSPDPLPTRATTAVCVAAA